MVRRLTLTVLLLLVGAFTVAVDAVPFAQRSASGPALAETPQGKVALAYYKAANAGDEAGLKKVLNEASAKVLDGPNGKTLIAALKGQTPPGATVISVSTDVAVARVDVEFRTPARTLRDRLKLVLVGTEWKVDMTSR
jgi:hypothetical protein